jgi:hypothetical protein
MSRLAAVFISAALLATGAQAKSPEKAPSITLDRPAVVGTSVLPAGSYRVELGNAPDTAKFIQGKRTIAEANYKVGIESAVYRGNAVHYRTEEGRERLTKIVLAGSGMAIEFPAEAVHGTGEPIAATADRP